MLMAFMFIIFIVIGLMIIVSKIGMTFLAKKQRIKNYGLLWIPGAGSLYEGKLLNYYLSYGKGFEIGFFIMNIISLLLYIVFFMGGPYASDPSYDLVTSLLDIYVGIVIIINMIFRTIAIKKSGYNIFVSILIGVFLTKFWTFFELSKTKN